MAEILETTESRWFKISVFVVSGFFVGFSIANVYYYNKIRSNDGGGGVSRGEATSMLWINAILLAVALIIFLWSIYRLVVGQEYRQALTQRAKLYAQSSGTGLYNPPVTQ